MELTQEREALNNEYTQLASQYGDLMFKKYALQKRVDELHARFDELTAKEAALPKGDNDN